MILILGDRVHSRLGSGNINMRGKKEMALRCGCCDCRDFREYENEKAISKIVEQELADPDLYFDPACSEY